MGGEGTVLNRICASLASFDDDALAALANKGLLRRAQKDLESEAPEIIEETDGELRVRVGDAVVRIPALPQNARCDCPAGTICRHILAALLHLRDSAPPADAPTSCAEEILAVDDESIRKWAGTPLVRKAEQRLARGLQVEIDDAVPATFTIPSANVIVRWVPGGGLEGMICSCHAPGACEHRICAVLAYQVSKGARTLSVEAAFLEASSGAPRTRDEVLAAVGSVLAEMIAQGISRLSSGIEQRLRTLAVSAHGVDLPRLERLLRSLSDEVGLFLSRDAQADAHNLLVTASRTEALRCALAKPAPALDGVHRSSYDAIGNVQVAGMGARRWRNRTGYLGLTLYFWDQSTSNWATWTDARPVTVERFDPLSRYKQEGPWGGCPSPAHASRSELRLTGVWRSPSGRLSGRPSTHSWSIGPSDPKTVPAVSRWEDLSARTARLFSESLGERNEQDEIVYLTPDRWGRRSYDQIRQEFTWPAIDTAGREIPLVLVHSPETAGAIGSLEKWSAPIDGVLGLLRFRGGRVILEPISIRSDGRFFNLTLDFDSSAVKTGDYTKGPAAEPEDDYEDEEQIAEGTSTPIGLLLASLSGELEMTADGGVLACTDLSRLTILARRTESIGLTAASIPVTHLIHAIERAHRSPGPDTLAAAESLLRAYYVLRVAQTTEMVVLG